MLKKLLKYDLKDMFKFLCIFYAIGLFFGVLTKLLGSFDNSFVIMVVRKVCQGAAIAMIFNIIINNLMRFWGRFSKNFYGDESYLTHTLPVKRSTHYNSKILASLITLFASVTVIAIILLVAVYSGELYEIIKKMITPLKEAFGTSFSLFVVMVFLILFLEFLNALQCGFSGIILGHKMNSGKVGFSVLFGFVTYIASQLIVLLIVFVVALFNKDFMNLFITADTISMSAIKTAVVSASFAYASVIILNYFVNLKLLKKGVNVD